eukprot:gene1087-1024_t
MAASSSHEVAPVPPQFEDDSEFNSSEEDRESDMDDEELDLFLMGANVKHKGKKRKRKRVDGQPNEEDDNDDNELALAKPKAKRKKAAWASTGTKNISKKAKDLLGKANFSFMNGDYTAAAESLMLVIQEAPGIAEPFHTLGIIHEEWGDMKKSEEFFLLAVHLTPNDAALWRRVAGIAKARGDLKQAVYCLKRCYRNCAVGTEDEEEMVDEVLWELANCHLEEGNPKKAMRYLQKLHEREPEDKARAKELAKGYHSIGRPSDCAKVLEKLVHAQLDKEKEVESHLLHMLCQVYCDPLRDYAKCFKLLEKIGTFSSATGLQTVPPEITAHAAVACCHMDKPDLMEKAIDVIRACPADEIFDLVLMIVDAAFEKGHKQLAEALMDEMLDDAPHLDKDPTVQLRYAKIYHAVEKYDKACNACERVIESMDQKQLEQETGLFVLYSEVLSRLGRHEDADEALQKIDWKDLQTAETLPAAMSKERRLDHFQKLKKLLDLKLDGKELLLIEDNVRAKIHRKEFVSLFTTLMRDCELDLSRIKQHRLKVAKAQQSALKLEDAKDALVKAEDSKDNNNNSSSVLVSTASSRAKNDSVVDDRNRAMWNYSTLMRELGLLCLEDEVSVKVFLDFLERGFEIFKLEGPAALKTAVQLSETIIQNRKRGQRLEYQPFTDGIDRLRMISLRLALHPKLPQKMLRVALSNLRNLGYEEELPDHTVAFYSRILFNMAQENTIPERERKQAVDGERKYLLRRLVKQPQSLPLTMIAGHVTTLVSKHQKSISEYVRAYSMSHGKNCLAVLCLAVAYINFSLSRTVRHRHVCLSKGIALMYEYANNFERDEAEKCYNLARAENNGGKDPEHLVPLRISVAQNLSLILRAGGNNDAARTVLFKNIVW